MSEQPDNAGMRGPQRSGPVSRGPVVESVSSRGAAYSAPPPEEHATAAGGPARFGRWWIAPVLAVALLGGAYIYNNTGSSPVAAQTTAASVAALTLAAADIDQPATDLAKALIASGAVPLPDIVAPAAATPSAAVAPQVARPETASVQLAPAVKAPTLAPVVHRPKQTAGAPKLTSPAPAPVAETEQAVRQILAQAPLEIRTAIVEGRTSIYSLHVVDDVVEDGDVVEIFVDGTSHGTILLSNAGQDRSFRSQRFYDTAADLPETYQSYIYLFRFHMYPLTIDYELIWSGG